MKRVAFAVFVLVAVTGSRVRAQDKFLCCDLNAGATAAPCVGQEAACARTGDYSVQLSDVPNSDAGWAPGATATIPTGQDGYVYWAPEKPYFGFCLVAPVAGDPKHQSNPSVDPLGCLRVTLGPGVSAEMLDVIVPNDPRWDGDQFCYGAADPLTGCQTIADGRDLTVSETPSGSCCGPALPFEDFTSSGKPEFGVNQHIPGVIPPQLVIHHGPDGGAIVPYFIPDPPDADQIISSADAGCLSVYDESRTCGSKPDGSPAPGAAAAGCSVSGGRTDSWAAALLAALAYLVVPRRRRAR